MLLLCNRDVEFNPGPKKNKEFPLSCCHWNVNSLLAHDCAKVTSLEAYNSVFKYDFICISETYIDSTISSDNNNLNILGYNLIRADHPSNSKRGSVSIYYKESLAVQTLNNIGLPVYLVCKVCLSNKTSYVVVIYRSPSQTYLEFQKFLTSFETLLQNLQNLNLHLTMILGDINARTYSWWPEDILSVEGNHTDSLTSMFGLHQVISGPIHILSQSSSCIDLRFTDQPHLVSNCSIHASLHPNCHHQITYCKLNLKMTYLPPL